MCSTVVGECVQYLGVLNGEKSNLPARLKEKTEDRRKKRQKMRVKNFSRQRAESRGEFGGL